LAGLTVVVKKNVDERVRRKRARKDVRAITYLIEWPSSNWCAAQRVIACQHFAYLYDCEEKEQCGEPVELAKR
jgi:hypothetical protein